MTQGYTHEETAHAACRSKSYYYFAITLFAMAYMSSSCVRAEIKHESPLKFVEQSQNNPGPQVSWNVKVSNIAKVQKPLPGKALLVMSIDDQEYIYDAKSEKISDDPLSSMLVIPIGEITRDTALAFLNASFEEGGMLATSIHDTSPYSLVLELEPPHISFSEHIREVTDADKESPNCVSHSTNFADDLTVGQLEMIMHVSAYGTNGFVVFDRYFRSGIVGAPFNLCRKSPDELKLYYYFYDQIVRPELIWEALLELMKLALNDIGITFSEELREIRFVPVLPEGREDFMEGLKDQFTE